MITIVMKVLFLKSDLRIVISVKDSLAWFEHGDALSMYDRSVEQEGCSRRTRKFDAVKHRQFFYLGPFQIVRVMLLVRSFNDIERAAAHICQIHGQLDFAMDLSLDVLVIPHVAVPTVKVAFRRQRLPAFRFREFVSR